MKKFIQTLLLLAGLGCLLFAAIPAVLYGILNTGVVALAVLAVLFLTLFWLLYRSHRRSPWEVFARQGGWRSGSITALSVLLAVFAVAELGLSAAMYFFGCKNLPSPESQATVVVLGAKLKNDKPSLMLLYRLEQALLYLNEHPQAQAVVTGGTAPNAAHSEASVMAQWLMDRGIAPERILQESQSTDTQENLRYTVALLTENSLPHSMVIVTDGFHQWRGQLYARLAIAENTANPTPQGFHGADVTGLPSRTPWGLIPCYWLREQAALVEAFLFTDIAWMMF